MRPTNKLFLFALIIFLLFGTVSVVFADESVDIAFNSSGTPVFCGDQILDAELSWAVDPVELVDYYQITLDPGQVLAVDVDSELIVNAGVVFDYILQFFDINGNSLADSDDAPAPGESGSLDPYLKYTATEHGTYIVAVSTWNANATHFYEITFECTDVGPVSELQPGDLLASTGPSDGSLISIDRETGTIDLRGTLGNYGQVVDIEFRDDDVLFGATIDDINQGGTIVTIDPNTGGETKIGTLQAGYVVALEFGRDPDSDLVSLYGIYQARNEPVSQFGIINQANGKFTVVGETGHTDHGKVDGLAFESNTGIMYGVGPGSNGIELMTIDLATGVTKTVGSTGLKISILALEFGPDGKLYGVTAPFKSDGLKTFVTALVTIDTANGTATEVVEVGGNAAEAAALAVASPTSMVSGLTFKPGWEPKPDSTTITSLDDNPYIGNFIDKFKFEGAQGELVTITVENLNQETEDALPLEGAETSPEVIETKSKWSKWRNNNFLVEGKFKGHAFFSLRDAIPDLRFRERVRGPMPLTIEAVLPASGLYYLILTQPVHRSLRVDYSLTMTSTEDAFTTLEATRLFERRKYTYGENKGTTDNTEQSGSIR